MSVNWPHRVTSQFHGIYPGDAVYKCPQFVSAGSWFLIPWAAFLSTKSRCASCSNDLLLYPQNRVLGRLGDSESDDGLSGNLDLLLRRRIEARTCLSLLLYELAKAGQDEFAVLFGIFVGDGTERIKEYAGGLFIGLRGFGKCALNFWFRHYTIYGSVITSFQDDLSFSRVSSH